ncbi:MAG: hypothetical protein ACAI43_04480 [Phycisphaerae bacterium]|nr:hypothetical protein [Tepidisphaeraceae bacterium]
MTVRIKAHYDGKTIVPDEPVDLPAGAEVTVEFRRREAPPAAPVFPMGSDEERRAALESFFSMTVPGLSIPDEALRRENMYSDEDDR